MYRTTKIKNATYHLLPLISSIKVWNFSNNEANNVNAETNIFLPLPSLSHTENWLTLEKQTKSENASIKVLFGSDIVPTRVFKGYCVDLKGERGCFSIRVEIDVA